MQRASGTEITTVRRQKPALLKELAKNKVLYLMLLPGLLVLLVNNYLPMFGIVIAFKDYNYAKGFWKSDWVGFNNFEYLFNSKAAFLITRNTILYNVAFIVIAATVAVVLAIIFNELLNRRISKFYQSVMFLPYFFSWVVISYLVFALLSSDMGFVNKILISNGMQPVEWYVDPRFWPLIIILVNTWKWTGYDSIIYLAAIIGFDKSLYEAAAVDGASRFQQITKVMVPMLMPVITVLTLIKVGRIFFTDFGLFFNIPRNSGPLYDVTNVIETYVFRALRQTGDIGMASAAGFYQAVVGFIVVMTANYIVRKIDKDSSLF
ncbi:MAG TPA: ABC transporter permease subunit [Bacillota bacterium]|nr:ABC transporter permease subunit [Bacillota bacterium]HPA53847.1 ABC transporter permease subunit [Bacillota bacterium]HPL99502.1 ABC transporter permease subunit [Bacillota bacterium]HPX69069.1 ABC transporter permease subunit [Bacillota bacterium]HQO42730.1 ABC transporter permease subunit [Bacillota bacterium]